MAQWTQRDHVAPVGYVRDIAGRMGRSADELIWFEHGSAAINAITGCGVDHAHLHLLVDPPFTFEQFRNA